MKTRYFKAILLLLCIFTAICIALVSLEKKQSEDLAILHAPIFHFDIQERFFPADYSKYFYDKDGNEFAPEIAIKNYLESSDKPAVFYSVDQEGEKTIIRYWLFYVYNDFVNKHFGDAETITIILDKNNQDKVIVGSAHIGNFTKIAIANNQITQPNNDQAHILVELGSHANCPDKNGDLIIGAQELDNWYNAYGISNWDIQDKYGANLSKNEYELFPLSILEEKLKGKEKLKNANNLGIGLDFKGNILGYEFDKTIYLPIGGNAVDLASIEPLKQNPGIAIPFSLGKDINNLSDLMIKNYSSQNPYRPDLADLIENNNTTTQQIGTGIEDKPIEPTNQEYQRLLEENKKLKQALDDISLMINALQKQVDSLKIATTTKQVKGASTTASVILINEFASGVENAEQEYIQIKNAGNIDIDLSKDFDLFIVSGTNKTNKKITWNNSVIKANSTIILADNSLDKKIKIDGYFSSGITQDSQIKIQYKNIDDASYLSEQLKTGYCAKRNGSNYEISKNCIVKMPEEKITETKKETITKTKTNNVNQGTSGAQNPVSSPIFYPVIINEIMYNPQGTDTDREWVEIYNNSTSTIDLSNWKLYENGTNHGLTLEQGNINLEPAGYMVIVDNKDKFKIDYPNFSGTILDSSFSLNDNETLILKNKDLEIDTVLYNSNSGAKNNGYSLQNFNGLWLESIPTPGTKNVLATSTTSTIVLENIATSTTSTTATTTPALENTDTTTTTATTTISISENAIIITEVMYDPKDADTNREWIEIYNNSTSTIDINDWKISDSANHSIKEQQGNLIIEPQKFAIITKNFHEFIKEYNFNGIIATSSISLPNSVTTTISIKDNNSFSINSITYNYLMGANDNGLSLQLINNSWQEACPTPGKENIVGICNQQEQEEETQSMAQAEDINNLLNSGNTTSTTSTIATSSQAVIPDTNPTSTEPSATSTTSSLPI